MRTDLPADGPDLFETVRVVSPWDYLQRARMSLAASEPVAAFRNWLKEGDRLLEARFLADEQVEDLVSDRARLVDLLLTKAWERHLPDDRVDLCLVAVGGYGRGELLPHSDIDIMILLPKTGAERWTSQLEGFLTFLWDIGLEVGHSVRTVDECKDEALADISVATTLIEARLLAGPDSLFTAMRRAIAPDRIRS
ncbi:MAG: nucleotidyltransferase domain-containing protein, partial [Steroidobacteraceae bacterium]